MYRTEPDAETMERLAERAKAVLRRIQTFRRVDLCRNDSHALIWIQGVMSILHKYREADDDNG